jgi:hypothetical protein
MNVDYQPVERADYLRTRIGTYLAKGYSAFLARELAHRDADDRELAIAGGHWLDKHPEEAPCA